MTDVGLYATKNVNANYGFGGGQVQRHLFEPTDWAAARASFVVLYGPEDLDFTLYGLDMVASRKVSLTTWERGSRSSAARQR